MINGLRIIYVKDGSDKRGASYKISFDYDFAPNEVFFSHSKRNVIRGMHLQVLPHTQKKIIYVVKGKVEGVVLDLRHDSETYMKSESIVMKECDNIALYIPENCAWGFEAMEDENIVAYAIEGIFDPECERGVRYDSFGHKWRCLSNGEDPVVSDRDMNLMGIDRWEQIRNGQN